MAATVTASLDVMGGDDGVNLVIPGADIALVRRPELRFRLYGNEALVSPVLARFPRVAEASTFVHCDIAVKMDESRARRSAAAATIRACGRRSRL